MIQKPPIEVVNFSNVTAKRALLEKLRKLTGPWEVSLKPRRQVRTLTQNAYYWAGVVQPFTEWLRDEWGDDWITGEQAHEILKKKILGAREMTDKDGEVIELPPTTRTLDTLEFGQYIDKCAAWLAEFCALVILPPEMYYEAKEPKRTLAQDLGESIMIAKSRKQKTA